MDIVKYKSFNEILPVIDLAYIITDILIINTLVHGFPHDIMFTTFSRKEVKENRCFFST